MRDIVIYPGVVSPLFVGRAASIEAIENAMKEKMQIVLVSQKQSAVDLPKVDDVYHVATLADIVQVLRLPDGTLKLLVEGLRRVQINEFLDDKLTTCDITLIRDQIDYSPTEVESVRLMLLKAFQRYLKLLRKQPQEILQSLADIKDLSMLSDVIASHVQVNVDKKMRLLLESNVKERVTQLLILLEGEQEIIHLEKAIRTRVKSQMDQNQREYYLNEQAKAIQKELENLDETKTEHGKLQAAIQAAKMPAAAEEKCLSELEKIKKMPPLSSEATVLRNYLEYMIDYPWAKGADAPLPLTEARDMLADSHYGLEDVKTRIVEYLAVQQRAEKPVGSILCLVGPPGVGKTSIGKSIAEAVNRQYVRMSLGGVRDEAEIRGHRRTYIGAMPGKIIQNIIKAKSHAPLFLLDEIDKMGSDHRGDPAAAMLEVLDPEQNHAFNDHYMEVDIDLSNVMFVATANSLDIPEPLRDRMEIVRIPGYTEGEKITIAKKYLLPRNIERNTLTSSDIKITDKALKLIVENYTREAGVRQLDRELGRLCRKVVTQIALGECEKASISQNNLVDYLGVAKFQRQAHTESESVGRINGLAWTSVGGELLNIEVSVLPGKGKVSLTGKLGDVMQESVQAAMTVVKAHVVDLGVSHTFFQEHDFHLHLPEAATPKDGPSAGTAIATALLSSVMGEPISHKVAMTGEITLQGRVLPIGGLKEKLFAAAREGIETVLIPKANEKDLADIPTEIIEQLQIVPVAKISQVFAQIFSNKLNKIKKIENRKLPFESYLLTNHSSEQKH